MRRRTFLVGLAVSGAAGLAGCLVTGGGGPDDTSTPAATEEPPTDTPPTDTPTDDETQTPGNPEALEVLDAAIETTEANCGGVDVAESDWRVDGDTVTVTGELVAPTPCHEAELEDVSVGNDRLALEVGVRSTLEADAECVQCVGRVAYRADVSVTDGARVSQVAVSAPTEP